MITKQTFTIRPFLAKDVSQLAQVFHLSITLGASEYYNEQQRAVWSPRLRSDDIWLDRLRGTFTWVAVCEQQIVGFINLKGGEQAQKQFTDFLLTAEIDCLFTHPDFVGQGVASALYTELEAKARCLNITQLTVEASYLAKLFFERVGFDCTRQNQHQREGQMLVNFSMVKSLL
ncbi:GNAT family N-acetyltransferase [Shewanella marinintestina]|uniref:GNAT family N-acetyltransferase n=1 Tax=Shewanella marinintestina TaxID=190305 RepID=UPI00200CEC80|nr:GNAT family N-acetyltransferase [Shewanella marinintestina]MCL1145334.1 GNAT family N-acetyltransferase [Shewanella marinintestina]